MTKNTPIYAGDPYSVVAGLSQAGRLAQVLEIPAPGYITLRWKDQPYGTITLTTDQFFEMFSLEMEHKFQPGTGKYPAYLYCVQCGASETDHRL